MKFRERTHAGLSRGTARQGRIEKTKSKFRIGAPPVEKA
jgi:hypothetical protein